MYFYPRSPCGERRVVSSAGTTGKSFLSTLSLRRATSAFSYSFLGILYFYPRSPCGERHLAAQRAVRCYTISIHALLAESDQATFCHRWDHHISIHALLAESDASNQLEQQEQRDFYPRSPCGERHNHRSRKQRHRNISIHALLAESDFSGSDWVQEFPISIHALLAESDTGGQSCNSTLVHFYPRSPCGERPSASGTLSDTSDVFLSTLSLRRATRCELGRNNRKVISIHALLAESD